MAGIREHVAAQRVNSCVTVVKRHVIEEYTEDFLQVPNNDNFENTIPSTPFLNTNDELEEFFDANMDQLSESSEVSAICLLVKLSFFEFILERFIAATQLSLLILLCCKLDTFIGIFDCSV